MRHRMGANLEAIIRQFAYLCPGQEPWGVQPADGDVKSGAESQVAQHRRRNQQVTGAAVVEGKCHGRLVWKRERLCHIGCLKSSCSQPAHLILKMRSSHYVT